jgi:hypothetical protein
MVRNGPPNTSARTVLELGDNRCWARWDDQTVTGGELLALVRERVPLYDCDDLDVIDELKSEGKAPTDKWSTP